MDTIEYYNKNADEFYKNTINLDMSELYQMFLKHIERGGHILDAGCGSGRDSLYFLKQGYRVTALDASKELVKLSSKLIEQKVLHMKFQEMDFEEVFSGIWACASLLHVSKKEIKTVLKKFIRALVRDGVIYMSFKYGDCEVDRNGRLFNYYNMESFRRLKDNFKGLELIKMWKTVDARKDRENEYWLNVLLKKIEKS